MSATRRVEDEVQTISQIQSSIFSQGKGAKWPRRQRLTEEHAGHRRRETTTADDDTDKIEGVTFPHFALSDQGAFLRIIPQLPNREESIATTPQTKPHHRY